MSVQLRLLRHLFVFGNDSKYDLIVKRGRVVDPSSKLDAIRDVAIANGHIVAIEANSSADAVETIVA